MSKAIIEVTYYCRKCRIPLVDDTTTLREETGGIKVKTGDLVCAECGQIVQGIKEYI